MTYTSVTAIIITLHHLSTVVALILAAIITTPIYLFILRKRKHRLLALCITFLITFVIASGASESAFVRSPISIEIINAG